MLPPDVPCAIAATTGTVTNTFDETSADYYHTCAATGSYSNSEQAQVFLRCSFSSASMLIGDTQSNGATITATKVADLTVLQSGNGGAGGHFSRSSRPRPCRARVPAQRLVSLRIVA